MLHKVSSSYHELARLVPGLVGRLRSSSRRKKILIEMAERGDPRPWRTKIGNSLVSYTNRKSTSYDPVFTKNIKKIAPEWFVTKFTIAKQKKRQLLRMAEKGSPKPYHKTKLGQAFRNYTRKASSPSYDPVFTKDIKKIAPEWFVTKYDIVNDKKRQLLRMARKKLPLPMMKTELGGALRSYTRKTSKSYCPIFDRKIRRAAPHWFTPQSEIADGKKQSLLELARQGKPRPKQNTVLGKALVRFITSGSSRDPNFIKEITKAAPQWFVTRSEIAHQKKLKLMELARQGKPRPNQKTHLGRALCNYTCRKCGSYDPNFTKEIQEAAPKWFASTRDVGKQNKRRLLALAKKGKPRPGQKTQPGQALCRYTGKTSPSYDPFFDKQIRTKAPLWFVKTSDQKKRQLLEIARKKLPRPNSKTKLGHSLCHYTSKTSGAYDPVFDKNIRKLAPHWFKKCSTK